MNITWISPQGITRHAPEALTGLLARTDGFLWLDLPACDDRMAETLERLMRFHHHGVTECRNRSPIPKLHVYNDHFFILMHTTEMGAGRVQSFQMSMFIHETRYLVTVHKAPTGDMVPELAWRETDAIRERMDQGRFRPRAPAELAHALVLASTQRIEACVNHLAEQVDRLENGITRGRLSEYERMLDGLSQVRRDLQTVRISTAASREVHARMLSFTRGLHEDTVFWLRDMADQYERLKNVCDSEKELLREVLDLYQSRVANDLSKLVRKLTALGSILVADTLVAGIYGMNFKHMPELSWYYGYPMALGMMVVLSAAMGWWFKKQDWL